MRSAAFMSLKRRISSARRVQPMADAKDPKLALLEPRHGIEKVKRRTRRNERSGHPRPKT